MRVTFDRGTLLFAHEGQAIDLANIPGILWDARVGTYRALPYRHGSIVANLRARGVRVLDEATRFARMPDTAPAPPALRDYQQTALGLWNGAGRRGVVALPTGSGKTVVALGAIATAASSALCLVPTRVLLHQWRDKLAEHHPGPIGVLGDGARTLEPVTVATFESAFRHMDRIGNRFELLIVDEAHHFGTGVRDEALEMCLAPARLGLTATPPSGEAEARLAELIGPIVYRLGVADLAGTFLSSYEIVPVHVELDLDERALYETS
jgi:superfamily II DNA or RNA helicase